MKEVIITPADYEIIPPEEEDEVQDSVTYLRPVGTNHRSNPPGVKQKVKKSIRRFQRTYLPARTPDDYPPGIRHTVAWYLRLMADRLSSETSFRCMNWRFRFEDWKGLVFDEKLGCELWYQTHHYNQAHEEGQ